MARRVASLTIIAGISLIVAGCFSVPSFERRANWRSSEERVCMRQTKLAASAYIQEISKINGRGACGVKKPLKVKALADGTITIGPTATIGCPMTAALEQWMKDAVQPAALAWFGVPVTEIKQISDYSCRRRNNARKGKLSEHAFGNALDIAGFTLMDGRTVTVLKGWKGSKSERGFLREVYAHGCRHFKTSLGPGAKYHADHFHFDLARHNSTGTSRYCKPKLKQNLPVRPPFGGYTIASNGAPVFAPTAPRPAFVQPAPAAPAYQTPVATAPPTNLLPTVLGPQYGAYPQAGPSPSPYPSQNTWPPQLPPANVPLGFAPQ